MGNEGSPWPFKIMRRGVLQTLASPSIFHHESGLSGLRRGIRKDLEGGTTLRARMMGSE